MPSIWELSNTTTLSDNDKIPIWSTESGVTNSIVFSDFRREIAGKQHRYIPVSDMKPTPTNGASGPTDIEINGIPYTYLEFSSTSNEYAFFSVVPPRSWDANGISFQTTWYSDQSNVLGVTWELTSVGMPDGNSMNITFGNTNSISDNASGTANVILICNESSLLDIGNDTSANTFITFKISRNVTDTYDQLVDPARLLGLRVYFTTNDTRDF